MSICCNPDEVSPVLLSTAAAAAAAVIFKPLNMFGIQEIDTDIKHGVLTSRITVPSVRTAMSKLLTAPNPELAETIRNKCLSLSNWYGLIPALFPNAKHVYGIMTGSMEPYVKKLRHYAGDLPLVSHDYGISEGWIAAAKVTPRLSPEEAMFAVIPNLGYFEFLPVSEREGEQEPVGLIEVKIGQDYSLKYVARYAGLYRYRLGDVLKITGFYKTPQVKSHMQEKPVYVHQHRQEHRKRPSAFIMPRLCRFRVRMW
ncbi:BnaCnng39810D [Brassica napus]|uniref:BnaCnng39810D protein n=1 Tax=Brassica napus TaxID=3708 RepID=A0A078JD50_BRANA|nr:BnaCnng39810D [Brassica napus]